MSVKRVIACLDVNDGRVVKGVNFVDLVDAGDPVESARAYQAQGADEIVFLDITATTEGRATTVDMAAEVAAVVDVPFTVGGGFRSVDDVRRMLEAGADKCGINSAAVGNPALIDDLVAEFGGERIVSAIDAKAIPDEPGTWEVVIAGGQKSTGIDVVDWACEMERRGVGSILLTSLDKDGTKDGFDTEMTRAVSDAVSIPVIASGGVGSLQDFADGITEGGADAVLAASVFHFGTFTIREVKEYMAEQGIEVALLPGWGAEE